jgi:trehalose 6-phosphate phosphatase
MAWAVVEQQQMEARCERKPASVALHWRGMPEVTAKEIETEIRKAWTPLTRGQLLELHSFDGGIELRACGRTKATAVREVLDALGDDQPVAFLGDDLTDEDGFRAIRGRGLGILVRKDFRPTAAEVHLRPPQGLLDFLDEWLRCAPRQLNMRGNCP